MAAIRNHNEVPTVVLLQADDINDGESFRHWPSSACVPEMGNESWTSLLGSTRKCSLFKFRKPGASPCLFGQLQNQSMVIMRALLYESLEASHAEQREKREKWLVFGPCLSAYFPCKYSRMKTEKQNEYVNSISET